MQIIWRLRVWVKVSSISFICADDVFEVYFASSFVGQNLLLTKYDCRVFFFCCHCLVVHSIQLKSAIFLISISPLWSNYIIVPFFVWSNPTAINYWRSEIQTDRQNPIHKVWLNLETVSTIEKQRPPSRWELND